MNASSFITINNREIGPGRPVYCVAEMSANHNRDFDQAVRIIHAAKDAGADAIKLQTYTPDTMTLRCDRPEFRVGKGTIWAGQMFHDLYETAHTPWDWHARLKAVADELGIDFFSTPFDPTAVEFLEDMGVPAHKVASFELVDIPLIEKIAATGKPMIISTGMATRDEIDAAVHAARSAGADQIALLKCTSAYPAPPEEMNLRGIPALSEAFAVPAGLSDHTLGIAVPIAAVALGACIVEKHFTLSRAVPGPDSTFSLEPHEFKDMVAAIRIAERSLGEACFEPTEREAACRAFRRSLFIVRDVRAGETLTAESVRSIRPADGLPPGCLSQVIGRKAARDLRRGTPLTWDLIASAAPLAASRT